MTDALHLTEAEIIDGMTEVRKSPHDNGLLEAIVIRPRPEERHSLQQCHLSPEGGTDGDAWARGCWLKLPDGSPHPDVQICITNSRMINLLAGEKHRWELAGDNLFVDLDLSRDNLHAGGRRMPGFARASSASSGKPRTKKSAGGSGRAGYRRGWSLTFLSILYHLWTLSVIKSRGDKDPKWRKMTVIDRIALKNAVAQLPNGYRNVFILHDVHGYEHEEVARLMGISVGTSKSQLHKARLKLRGLLIKQS